MKLRACLVFAVCAASECTACPAAEIAFRRHVINADSTYSAAAAIDVNRDGKLDILCGGFWYEAPEWNKHFVRDVESIGGRFDGYAHLPLDLNGDGWTDIITVNYRSRSIKWLQHPGVGLGPWTAHLVEEPGPSETGRLVDIDGDGRADILPNGTTFAAWWELLPRPSGAAPKWKRHDLPLEVAGHGIGFGDVNGDGRGDIVGPKGWLEAPPDRRAGPWRWHAEFDLDGASVPILVVDVDGDGDNDLVTSRAHAFGLFWLEQDTSVLGHRAWRRHQIDTSWSQAHELLWEDLDRDGQPELVAGKRYMAHDGRDPGEYDPLEVYRYQFDRATRTWRRSFISFGQGVGIGLDPKAIDLDADGDLDLIAAGRSGLYWLENVPAADDAGEDAPRAKPAAPLYSDHAKLLVVKDERGEERPVETPFDWGLRRAHVLSAVELVLGPLPDPSRRVPLDERIESEADAEHYLRRRISYSAESGDRVSAYLLIPKNLSRKAPAMIWLHDAVATGKKAVALGKDESAEINSRSRLALADELARRGYVCLVPDDPAFGEAKLDGRAAADNAQSGLMKAVWHNIRGIDLLESQPEVDIDRIGCVGHGLGGTVALFLAAFDQRIAAAIVSDGFTSWSHYKGGDLSDWRQPHLAPRIVEVYGGDPRRVPFDFAELAAAVAPRGLFVSASADHPALGVSGVRGALDAAARIYALRKAEGRLNAAYPQSGRQFAEQAQGEAFLWLDALLKP